MADDTPQHAAKPDYKKLNACVASVVAKHSQADAQLSYERYDNGNSSFIANTSNRKVTGDIFSDGDIEATIDRNPKDIHIPGAVGLARLSEHYKNVEATHGGANVTGTATMPSPPPALEKEAVSMAKEMGACMTSPGIPTPTKSFKGFKP